MAKVTGQITDFGFNPLRKNNLRLSFRHTTPGVAGAAIMTTRPVEVTVASNGYFEADLTPSARIAPAGWYSVTLEWTEPPSKKVYREVFPGRLFVPSAGGVLSNLLRVPANPALVLVGEEPPLDPSPGTWWMDPAGDLSEFGAGGWTFKENLRGPAGYNATTAAENIATLAGYVKQSAGPNAFAAELAAHFAPSTNAATVTYHTNASPAYNYTVTTVRTGGRFVPGLVKQHYGGDLEKTDKRGADFKPPQENLEYFYKRTGYNVLANSAGWKVSGNLNEIVGCQIKDGVILHDFNPSTGTGSVDNGMKGTDALGFKANGRSKIYSHRWGDTAASMVADGVVDSFSFGPALVVDGVIQPMNANPQWGTFNTDVSARQILGQTATGDIVLITTEGATGVYGMAGDECAAVAKRHGCHNAIMLDGGGSAQTLINGDWAHLSSDGPRFRPVPAFLAIRTTVTNQLDTGWVDIPYTDGYKYPGSETGRRLRARRRGTRVEVKGRALPVAGGNATVPASTYTALGTLPRDFQPAEPAAYAAASNGLNGLIAGGVVSIQPKTRPLLAKPAVDATWVEISGTYHIW